ncbi:uncharacterized protein LOC122040759 [Zingiber officinale]|uniref:Uncharacterized protein n=1 Tax=Zingiber officinale TaxID=94328 RepID=A0A8J5LVK4_ZINOF|nr:uncharacterized protein LOC122002177 [Zingiber officinale]XP_042456122.1 uncharacterized protein LOC122040759 [Zingiber officinale]KAG6532718.1 hypothetical protein ZIOFF_006568 [Zingiber officinale]KAG6537003.1 hypothetical protein ZIOFF_002081 [Zingiber officinale]
MGNCIDSERPATWVDEEDEWESQSPSWRHERQREGRISLLNRSEEEVEEENRRKRTATTKIKIKVSKKQLEELLHQVNGDRPVAFRRILAELASESWREARREQEDQAGHWRPELQSIPEVPE